MYNARSFFIDAHFKNWFFESQPQSDFQKTSFGFFSAVGIEEPKTGFIQSFALKPEPINFLKVLLSNTFKKFIEVRLIGNCCN